MQTPQVLFDDRLLTCSDCNSEFIFTAGEQLFFHDKQFKNDPKRCKPCKSRRSGLSAVANGTGLPAAGLSRTETRTECSECGIQTTVPFKPTQGRPVLCRQCFQIKGRAAPLATPGPASQPVAGTVLAPVAESATRQSPLPLAASPAESATGQSPFPLAASPAPAGAQGLASNLVEASLEPTGLMLSPEAAILAATSLSHASAQSSVASAADLASIQAPATPGAQEAPLVPVPVALLSAQGQPAAEIPTLHLEALGS